VKLAKLSGICVQALILGTLLFFALARLAALRSGARVFRYQAF
jgi:hypothetical protein